MKRYTVISVFSVMMVMCQGQTNPYRAASSSLRPLSSAQDGQLPQDSVPASFSISPPQPPPAPSPPVADSNSATTSPAQGKSLGPLDLALLQTFDDYMFENLEEVYYRLSYAFKDATKRTLTKCGCDMGEGKPLKQDPVTPPA